MSVVGSLLNTHSFQLIELTNTIVYHQTL